MDLRYKFVQCRLCLYEKECLSDIFEDNGRQGFTAAELIRDLLLFKVSRMDGYPQLVCLDCLDKLIDFKHFKEQCRDAKSRFERNFLPNISLLHFQNIAGSVRSDTEIMEDLTKDCDGKNADVDGYQKIHDGQTDPAEFCDVIVKEEPEELVPVNVAHQAHSKVMRMDDPDYEQKALDYSMTGSENGTPLLYKVEEIRVEGKKLFKCRECGKCFVTKWKVKRHLPVHTRVVAPKPPKPVVRPRQPRADPNVPILMIGEVKVRRKKICACDICGKCFATKWKLNRHLQVHLKANPRLTVTIGGEVVQPRAPTIGENGERSFSCDLCGNKFTQKSSLTTHMRIHTGEKPFSCHVCAKAFRQSGALLMHVRKVHNVERYECDLCTRTFRKHETLLSHMETHNGEPYNCVQCGVSFPSADEMAHHRILHREGLVFECDLCRKKYKQKKRLVRHLKKHANGEL